MNDRHVGLFSAIVLVMAAAVSSRVLASSVTLIAPTGEAPSDLFGFSVARAGDVNQDGTTNSVDAFLILQFHAGLLPILPIPVP